MDFMEYIILPAETCSHMTHIHQIESVKEKDKFCGACLHERTSPDTHTAPPRPERERVYMSRQIKIVCVYNKMFDGAVYEVYAMLCDRKYYIHRYFQ